MDYSNHVDLIKCTLYFFWQEALAVELLTHAWILLRALAY